MKTSVLVVVVSLVVLLCCCLPAAMVADAAAGTRNGDGTCLYLISVQTGTVDDAGTDAKISVTFQSADSVERLSIGDLESWSHDKSDPFENGSLDTFQGYDRCMMNICKMLLVSDNTGNKPGWYVEYVRLEIIRNGSSDVVGDLFELNQWLALDEPPHRLYAKSNVCSGGGSTGDAEAGTATM